MGIRTCGNRPGYKIFSFDTSLRNPKRNIEFLEVFKKFDGKPFDSKAKEKYLAECVKNGVYRFTNIDQNIKNKLENDIELTSEEVKQAFIDNPQATGFANRVVTHLRGLKDQFFLDFVKSGRCKEGALYKITPLGHLLLENNVLQSDIYTISMIGLHGKSPIRTAVYNKTRPFLNTLFVMEEVRKQTIAQHKEFKGILTHEFAAFVLSMKDCDYRKAASKIMQYRTKYGLEINKQYIENYIYNELGLLPISFDTLMKDYVDDVYRKFELTGLLRKRGMYRYTYIDFSIQNFGKVKQILDEFGGYYWHDFSSKAEYYDFVDSIQLPWNNDEKSRQLVLQEKADALGVQIDLTKGLDELEAYLNEISSQTAIVKQVENYSLEEIINELLILSGDSDKAPSSKVEGLTEPLRLEFLLALLFGKKYGPSHVVSNLIYNDDGEPLNFAPGGKSDISFHSSDLNLIIEATMIKNKNQQLNSETSNLSRHLEDMENRSGTCFGMTLVAPYIHRDTCDYFEYTASRRNVKVCPLKISRILELIQISDTSDIFKNNFEIIVNALKESSSCLIDFVEFINCKYLTFAENKHLYKTSYEKILYSILEKAFKDNKLLCI